MNTEVMTITPRLAKSWIEKYSNPRNRNISESAVANYARAMATGQWQLNGEAIIFDSNGILTNGHHRLHALVRSNSSVEFLIIRGVNASAFTTYDTGMKRSISHVLQMAEVPYANDIACSISNLIIYRSALDRSGSWNTYIRPNSQEVLDEYNKNPSEFDYAAKACKKCGSIAKASWTGGLVAYLLIDRNHEQDSVSYFMEKLKTGEMLNNGDPILALRNSYIKAKSDRTRMGVSKSANWHKNAFILGWNAHYEGRSISRIQVSEPNKAIQIK
jgi:hypothetical protein